MEGLPVNRIHPKGLTAWRITQSIIVLLVWIALLVYPIRWLYRWNVVYTLLIVFCLLIISFTLIFLITKIRWFRWRYEIKQSEIYLQRGIIIVTRTIVPMVRIQHVDTKQGPIFKAFGLATVQISTAATVHEIPALLENDATHLRDSIAHLAQLGDEDV